MGAPLDRGTGYAFVLGLCAAIDRALATAEAADRGTLSNGATTLRFAVEREVYVQLLNDDAVFSAFAAWSAGQLGHPVTARDEVDERVLRELFPGDPSEAPVKRTPRSLRARLSASRPVRAAIRAQRRRLGAPSTDGVRPGSALFLVGRPKFVPFVEPLAAALSPDASAAVATDAAAVELLARRSLPFVDARGPQLLYPPDRRALGRLLREREHLAATFDHFVRLLELTAPSCLVVIEGNASTDELFSRAGQTLGIPTLCVQQGWAAIVHTGFRNMSYSRMAVWGEGFAELLAPENPQQRFTVTGSHMLAQSAPGAEPLERRGAGPAVAFFLQPPTYLISEADEVALIRLARDTAERNPASTVYVREHPGARADPAALAEVTSLPNVVLANAPDHALRDVLDASAVVVSIYSTTLIEAAAAMRPVVIFNPTALPGFVPDLAGLGAGVQEREPAAAADRITRMLEDAAYRDSFTPALTAVRERFFASMPADAAERVAGVIRELQATRDGGPAPR